MKDSYSYPDKDDRIISRFIQTHEPWPGYWNLSEKWILQRAQYHLQANFNGSADLRLLDAGCGTGRLLIDFKDFFSQIYAVDPDEKQLCKARTVIASYKMESKVTLLKGSIENLDLPNHSMDVVLCSHVLQHVPTTAVDSILRTLASVLKSKGLLFLTVAHSCASSDTYSCARLAGSEIREDSITGEEFDEYVSLKSKYILPTHHFTLDTIAEKLCRDRLDIIESRVFHTLFSLPLVNGINKYINWDAVINGLPFLKQRYGRDLFLVARKKR